MRILDYEHEYDYEHELILVTRFSTALSPTPPFSSFLLRPRCISPQTVALDLADFSGFVESSGCTTAENIRERPKPSGERRPSAFGLFAAEGGTYEAVRGDVLGAGRAERLHFISES